MKHPLLLLCSALLPLTLQAEHVPVDRAKHIATQFLQANQQSRSTTVALDMVYDGSDLPTRGTAGAPPFYVFNNHNGNGYVIVSGEDAARPIFGYSTESNFNAQEIPDNMKAWFSGMKEQVDWLRTNHINQSQEYAKAWKQVPSRAIPWVVRHETASWGQGEPFNNECPLIEGRHCPTGCTITATAIVMKYHQWPAHGTGTIPAYKSYYKDTEIAMPSRTLGEPYHWNKLPLTYSKEGHPQEEVSEINRLMMDLGTLLQAGYSPTATGAPTFYIPAKLAQYMGYDASAHEIERMHFNDDRWHELIQKDLRENGPIIYSGTDGCVGHAYVVYGYTESRFYGINWGWGYANDGVFVLEASESFDDPRYVQYPNRQYAVIGLKKDEGNKLTAEEVTIGNLYTNTLKIGRNQPFNIEISNIYREGNHLPKQITIACWLTDSQGNPKEKLSEDMIIEGYSSQTETLAVPYLTCQIKNSFQANDRIRIFYKSEFTPAWTPIGTSQDSIFEFIVQDASGRLKTIEGLSLEYNRIAQLLIVHFEKGVKVKVSNYEGSLNHRCAVGDDYIIIPKRRLKGNLLKFFFQKGEVKRTFNFIIDNKYNLQ